MNTTILNAMVTAAMEGMFVAAAKHKLPDKDVSMYASFAGLALAGIFATQQGLPLLDFIRQAKQSYEHYAGPPPVKGASR
jgi:hypothetical protein